MGGLSSRRLLTWSRPSAGSPPYCRPCAGAASSQVDYDPLRWTFAFLSSIKSTASGREGSVQFLPGLPESCQSSRFSGLTAVALGQVRLRELVPELYQLLS